MSKSDSPQTTKGEASASCHCYAFLDSRGEIDLDSIAETEDDAKLKTLEGVMGWRFQYPDRYDQDEAWNNILKYGKIVAVSVSVKYA